VFYLFPRPETLFFLSRRRRRVFSKTVFAERKKQSKIRPAPTAEMPREPRGKRSRKRGGRTLCVCRFLF
jgi:hypothetical protein